CDLALAASGTVTVEAALLGAPMVTFYQVTPLTYRLGKLLVKVPFFSMVNLIAGRALVPELIQSQMTPENLAREALRLLTDPAAPKPRAAPRSPFRIFWKDKLPMFHKSRLAPISAALAFAFGAFSLQAQPADRRARIDVEQYTIDADISPATGSINAKATVRF